MRVRTDRDRVRVRGDRVRVRMRVRGDRVCAQPFEQVVADP